MAKIFNTETKEIVELTLMFEGQDISNEIIGGCNQDGCFNTEDQPDVADWAMDTEGIEWWTRWVEREEAILAATDTDEKAAMIAGLAAEYGHDMEVLQDKSEEALGIGI